MYGIDLFCDSFIELTFVCSLFIQSVLRHLAKRFHSESVLISPTRCSMSACWLNTQTSVWPQLFSVSESGYTRNRPQPSNPWNAHSTTSMSGLLQSLRADAARRRQQERGSQHGTPMPSPARARAVGRVVSHTERASIMDRVARTLFLWGKASGPKRDNRSNYLGRERR